LWVAVVKSRGLNAVGVCSQKGGMYFLLNVIRAREGMPAQTGHER
jgi:hypothetical protein